MFLFFLYTYIFLAFANAWCNFIPFGKYFESLLYYITNKAKAWRSFVSKESKYRDIHTLLTVSTILLQIQFCQPKRFNLTCKYLCRIVGFLESTWTCCNPTSWVDSGICSFTLWYSFTYVVFTTVSTSNYYGNSHTFDSNHEEMKNFIILYYPFTYLLVYLGQFVGFSRCGVHIFNGFVSWCKSEKYIFIFLSLPLRN